MSILGIQRFPLKFGILRRMYMLSAVNFKILKNLEMYLVLSNEHIINISINYKYIIINIYIYIYIYTYIYIYIFNIDDIEVNKILVS